MRNFVLSKKGAINLWETWFQEYLKPFNLDINSLIDNISDKGRVYDVTTSCVKTIDNKNYYCPTLLDYKNYLITAGDSYIVKDSKDKCIEFIKSGKSIPTNIEAVASGQAIFRQTQPVNVSTPNQYSKDDYYQFQYGVAAVYQIQTLGQDLGFKYTSNYSENLFYILPCSLSYRDQHNQNGCIYSHLLRLYAYYNDGKSTDEIPLLENNIQPHYETVYIDYNTYESIYIEDTLIDAGDYYYSISRIDSSLSDDAKSVITKGHLLTI